MFRMRRWFFKTKEEKKQERAEALERAKLKALQQELKREAQYYGREFPNWFAEAGIDHKLPVADQPTLMQSLLLGASGRQKVVILEVQCTEFAHYIWIDPRYGPYRSRIADIHNDEILEHLSYCAGRTVVWRGTPQTGAWFTIWRDGAINAIPTMFKFNEASQMITDKDSPLTFIVGVTENNRLVKSDLAMLPHYLVAGSTFMGKSVHLNQILCLFIKRNTKETLQFLMIDLKGGSEFAFYEGLPHLTQPIVTSAEDVPDALIGYKTEMARRMKLFSSRGLKNLEDWNKTYPEEKLPYIVLVFDELSLIMMHPDRKISKQVNLIMNEIMATSRSSGGHAILCTQRPSANVIPSYITANAGGRICFAVPSYTDSIVVIDNGMASKIDPEVRGRAIWSKGPQLTELQSPFISDHQIRETVKAAITGTPAEERGPDKVTLQEVFETAVDQLGGKMHEQKLFEYFRGRISRDDLTAMVKGVNGQPITVHGIHYRFIKGGWGRHGGKRLERIANDLTTPLTKSFLKFNIATVTHKPASSGVASEESSKESQGVNS